jgi:hypothetical protein
MGEKGETRRQYIILDAISPEEVTMTAMSNAEFAAHLLELAQDAPAFQPVAVYDADGDCIEFLSRPDPFYAERVDGLITVYRSQESGQVIGSLIKGIHPLLKKHPGLRIEVRDGSVRLVHLIRARLWTSNLDPADILSVTYRKLIEVAEESNVETELTPIAG